MSYSFVEEYKVVDATAGPVTTNGGVTSDWVSLKNAHKAVISLQFTQAVGHATVITLRQAQAVAGIGAKDLAANVPIWANEDTAGDDTLVRKPDGVAYTLAADVKKKQVIIEVDPAKAEAYEVVSRRLDAADAFLVVTPEYNHSFPAPLKELVDGYGTEWHAKPVAFVSYGGISGGLRAVEHLRGVFAELHTVGVRDTVSFAGAWKRFGPDGMLRDPAEAELAQGVEEEGGADEAHEQAEQPEQARLGQVGPRPAENGDRNRHTHHGHRDDQLDADRGQQQCRVPRDGHTRLQLLKPTLRHLGRAGRIRRRY